MTDRLRLPAFPLLTSDPYLSVWLSADGPAEDDTRHWTGERKRLEVLATVDNRSFALLGRPQGLLAAPCTGICVSPTTTAFHYTLPGVELTLSLCAPLLPDDWDLLSMPVTYVTLTAHSVDADPHLLGTALLWHDDICYRGETLKPMQGESFADGGLPFVRMGRMEQTPLCHSGDRLSIDWGFAYLAGDAVLAYEAVDGHHALTARAEGICAADDFNQSLLLAYDDVASIQYFGYTARAWYARDGASIADALRLCQKNRERNLAKCRALDEDLTARARAAGGESYCTLVCASFRQSVAAHKLIADKDGCPVFLSKENGSNGCVGTADVSYPSAPLFLLYSPDLVRAMCRPIFRFADLPIWTYVYAPHDVGRYPYATGQVYGLAKDAFPPGEIPAEGMDTVYPPLYLYSARLPDAYDPQFQMPVEECSNMVLLTVAAMRADGRTDFARCHLPLLRQWVGYILEYGADPGHQLCTDDFTGRLSHNVNLALKAVFAIAAYGWMAGQLGDWEQSVFFRQKSVDYAAQVLRDARLDDHTALTFGGEGWSLKYNAVWDRLFGFGLLDEEFFAGELACYASHRHRYGVPLDHRETYTKSDWQLWVAAMSDDPAVIESFSAPIARYLAETPSRFPFPDWYDTITGEHYQFINRSVQGGIFMPLLAEAWRAD